MKKLASALAYLVVLVLLTTLATSQVSAGTTTATLNVSVVVDSGCAVSTNPVVFSTYETVGTNATLPDTSTSGSIIVTCTPGTVANIGLNLGANGNGTQARAISGTNYMTYNLYQDAGFSTLWGNTSPTWFTTTPAPSTSPRSYTIYGSMPAGQSSPGGTYTDTVTATVNF